MPDLQALLDQIQRLDQEATKGPWHEDGDEVLGDFYEDHGYLKAPVLGVVWQNEHDAEFISLSRSALPKLAKVIDGLIEHCHNVMSWETPRGHEERIAVESRKQGARAVYKAITDALGDDDG